ncbi:MAG: metallophosphoesterase, partial [Planctomycetes bacterium]|nr:metallophosphoesterase [Planctomycetota bacterium]
PQYQRDKPAFGLLRLLPLPALLHEPLRRPAGGAPRDPDGWNMFLEETASLRLEDRVPFVFVPGNHDVYHDFDRAEIARLFGATHSRALWRSFDVGPWRFVILDTGSDVREDFDPLEREGLQLRWLTEQLSGAEAAGLHAIVCTHFPPYTSGAQDPPNPVVREGVARAILSKHDVALVLSGHVHAYERLEVADAKGRMVTHVVTGGAGGPFHGIDEKRREAGSKAFVGHLRHFVLLEMTETEIRGKMVPVASPEAYVENWQEKAGDEFVVKLR